MEPFVYTLMSLGRKILEFWKFERIGEYSAVVYCIASQPNIRTWISLNVQEALLAFRAIVLQINGRFDM
ncbi:hypothetical protein HYALB_00000266 [Hymenoscyphus albidus]|uniref:Uncharacterized protein n=1 Tax=Hymenoscyphus albidus TaxID=595503 RepID=A0A9N9LRA1_9HELO|nr:hypothetical protein HYALB_00000266 [Hymenoscyphus albidus]